MERLFSLSALFPPPPPDVALATPWSCHRSSCSRPRLSPCHTCSSTPHACEIRPLSWECSNSRARRGSRPRVTRLFTLAGKRVRLAVARVLSEGRGIEQVGSPQFVVFAIENLSVIWESKSIQASVCLDRSPASKHSRGLVANNLAEARFLTVLLPHNLSLFTP